MWQSRAYCSEVERAKPLAANQQRESNRRASESDAQ